MNNSSFSIGRVKQDVTVDPFHITGSNNIFDFILNVPLHFTFRPYSEYEKYYANMVVAELSYNDLKLSQAMVLLDYEVNYGTTDKSLARNIYLDFKLTEQQLYYIDRSRTNDIQFHIEFVFSLFVDVYDRNLIGSQEKLIRQRNEICNGAIPISIPKSIWVERLLKEFKYKQLRLIEIPLEHSEINEAYQKINLKFEKAIDFFKKQDYTETVNSCRVVIDDIYQVLRDNKDGHINNIRFKWLELVGDSTLTYMKEQSKAISGMTSKGHHSLVTFTKNEAETIYLITLSFMNFVGHTKLIAESNIHLTNEGNV